MEYSVLVCDTM